MNDFTIEKDFQEHIIKDKELQKDICDLLNVDFTRANFGREIEFVNRIVPDFTLFESGKIRAFIECKGGGIRVNDFVRGIGQIFTYEFFAEEKLSIKDYKYCDFADFSSVYIFPDSVLRNHDFNIGLFKYPQSSKILEVNSNSLAVRLIDKNELLRLKNSKEANIKVISQYYIRDNRLFELYFLLKVLMLFKIKGKEVHRERLYGENSLLRKSNTINNKNYKNAFISLSSLGFIDKDNYPTQAGILYANNPFEEFAYMLLKSYLMPYYEVIFSVLPQNLNASNNELCEKIRENFNCKTDILFLTQSNGRYISSWLNIARDDFAFIDFKAKSTLRKILLNPIISNEQNIKNHIAKHSKFNEFKANFQRIYDEI